jgi:hypothetical protein
VGQGAVVHRSSFHRPTSYILARQVAWASYFRRDGGLVYMGRAVTEGKPKRRTDRNAAPSGTLLKSLCALALGARAPYELLYPASPVVRYSLLHLRMDNSASLASGMSGV